MYTKCPVHVTIYTERTECPLGLPWYASILDNGSMVATAYSASREGAIWAAVRLYRATKADK